MARVIRPRVQGSMCLLTCSQRDGPPTCDPATPSAAPETFDAIHRMRVMPPIPDHARRHRVASRYQAPRGAMHPGHADARPRSVDMGHRNVKKMHCARTFVLARPDPMDILPQNRGG